MHLETNQVQNTSFNLPSDSNANHSPRNINRTDRSFNVANLDVQLNTVGVETINDRDLHSGDRKTTLGAVEANGDRNVNDTTLNDREANNLPLASIATQEAD